MVRELYLYPLNIFSTLCLAESYNCGDWYACAWCVPIKCWFWSFVNPSEDIIAWCWVFNNSMAPRMFAACARRSEPCWLDPLNCGRCWSGRQALLGILEPGGLEDFRGVLRPACNSEISGLDASSGICIRGQRCLQQYITSNTRGYCVLNRSLCSVSENISEGEES